MNSFGILSNTESVAGLSENKNFDANRSISAAFVEFQIPLTETVDVQLAGRYEDYGSSIGSTFDPKIGIRRQATDALTLRSSASSSFRGPGLAQIEEGTGFSRDNLGISYRQNSHAARFNMRFIGGYEDNASVNNQIDDGQIDAYYSFDLNYSYTMDLNDSALIISLGAIDLFEADLPRLKNANGTDLSTFDIRGRRVYGSVKFIL